MYIKQSAYLAELRESANVWILARFVNFAAVRPATKKRILIPLPLSTSSSLPLTKVYCRCV